MSGRGRRQLKPLSQDLAEPVRAFTVKFRQAYWERTELNQRELASALHLTKSPVSRYLNGQEVIPAPAFEEFCALAGLTARKREQLRRLREKAEAAGRGAEERQDDGPAPAPVARPVRGRGRAGRLGLPLPLSRRAMCWLAAAVVLAVAAAAGGVMAATGFLADGGRHGESPGTSAGPDCRQTRVYEVTSDGDILDERRQDIGDVHHDDVFSLDTVPPASSYHSRHYGHVAGRRITGYVDQAKLMPLGRQCVKGAPAHDARRPAPRG